MPEDFITYLPSLIGTMQPIQYQSCFVDRLLLVLSEQSMNSEWVKTEIRKARRAELREGRASGGR